MAIYNDDTTKKKSKDEAGT